MPARHLIAMALGLLLWSCQSDTLREKGTLILNATLVPIEEGAVEEPVYLLIQGDTIADTGPMSRAPKPGPHTTLIDAGGLYLMPGLTDGFAAINNQHYADAYLQMGITSIISVDGGRRGPFFGDAKPSPTIFRLEGVGDEKITDEELLHDIDSLHQAGYRVLLLMYKLTPAQIRLALDQARRLNMATIGELGYTTYAQGMDMGIDAFVHTTRYSLDVAPRNMAAAVAEEPFSNDLQSPKWKYYHYLSGLSPNDTALIAHARALGASGTYLLPTSSLSYLDLPEHRNPWDEPVARLLSPEDINRPANPQTGQHDIDSVEQAAYTRLILSELHTLEPTYYRHGAHYLTGSGTDVWGTMPGISLHTELELMNTYTGLSPREILAASTLNFSKAFGWNIGRIQKGYLANLLLLRENPLQNLKTLKHPALVMVQGQTVRPKQ